MGQLTSVVWPFEMQETVERCRCGAHMVCFLSQEGKPLTWKPRRCEDCYLQSCRTSTGKAVHLVNSKETWMRLVKTEEYLKK